MLDLRVLEKVLTEFNTDPTEVKFTEMLNDQDGIVRKVLTATLAGELFDVIRNTAEAAPEQAVALDIGSVVDTIVLRVIANIRRIELEEYSSNGTH